MITVKRLAERADVTPDEEGRVSVCRVPAASRWADT